VIRAARAAETQLCHARSEGRRLVCRGIAMLLPCSCYAIAMLLPCSCHALCHAIAVLLFGSLLHDTEQAHLEVMCM
jgi:hypothetical protein